MSVIKKTNFSIRNSLSTSKFLLARTYGRNYRQKLSPAVHFLIVSLNFCFSRLYVLFGKNLRSSNLCAWLCLGVLSLKRKPWAAACLLLSNRKCFLFWRLYRILPGRFVKIPFFVDFVCKLKVGLFPIVYTP